MNAAAANQEVWTVARLLEWTRDYFDRRGLESARLCAEILLAHALGCERINLYTRFDEVPGADVLHDYRDTVRQAAAGKPIAYLTGSKEFFSLPFDVTPDVLIPRPETEVLVERTIDLARRSTGSIRSIVDLGTGSGCIAVSLARHLPEADVYASDVSGAALAVARQNAEKHGVRERITFRSGDWFGAWGPEKTDAGSHAQRFDIIVSNPPYVADARTDELPANVRDFEPRAALFAGADGLDAARVLVRAAPVHLNAGGYLLMEVAYNQAAAVRGLFNESVWCEVVCHRDGLNHERVVQARLRAANQAQTA